jgi:hypothetical protein
MSRWADEVAQDMVAPLSPGLLSQGFLDLAKPVTANTLDNP